MKNKVKRGDMPDKEKWMKYPVRVFVYCGMFYLFLLLPVTFSGT